MPGDVVSFGETMLRLNTPTGMRLEDAHSFNVYVGGTESNTLVCLARLKLNTTWLSALPTNALGRHVEAELRRHGVNTTSVVWTADTTRLGLFFSEEAANPLGIQFIYDRANSACALLDPDVVDLSLVDNARLLLLTGITLALSDNTREVCRRLLERARTHHVLLSFDVNYRAKLWSPTEASATIEDACRQADLLFCTRADASELWHFTGSPESILRQMASRFGTEYEHKTYILTLGSEGSAQLKDGIYSAEPPFPTEGTHRIGSGDAFAAGYLYAYLNGPLYHDMCGQRPVTPLTFGNALAALKRCIPGDIARITPDDVKGLLQQQAGTRFR